MQFLEALRLLESALKQGFMPTNQFQCPDSNEGVKTILQLVINEYNNDHKPKTTTQDPDAQNAFANASQHRLTTPESWAHFADGMVNYIRNINSLETRLAWVDQVRTLCDDGTPLLARMDSLMQDITGDEMCGFAARSLSHTPSP